MNISQKMQINELLFEITRRCNMNCQHCLRGNAQDMDISRETIDTVLDSVSCISTITFTGGEPSLNPSAIQYVLDGCIAREIPIYGFFIATNGKLVSDEFLTSVMKLHAYCLRCGAEQDVCTLALSTDPFHDPIPSLNADLLQTLSSFDGRCKANNSSFVYLREGRGQTLNNRYRTRDIKHYDPIVEMIDGQYCVTDGYIYISADGQIRTECDCAYDNDAYAIGNVHDGPFINQIVDALFDEARTL